MKTFEPYKDKLTIDEVLKYHKNDIKIGLYVILESEITGTKDTCFSVVGLTSHAIANKEFIVLHQFEEGFCAQVFPVAKYKVISIVAKGEIFSKIYQLNQAKKKRVKCDNCNDKGQDLYVPGDCESCNGTGFNE